MDLLELGEAAGKVWQGLARHGPTLSKNLPPALGLESILVHMALGWLAREGKITFERKGGDLLVALRAEELKE